MKRLLILLLILPLVAAQDVQIALPEFAAWVECVERGPYPGRAVANLSYRYAGEFALVAEDSRYFGDTATGETEVFQFQIMPGEHSRMARVDVGALKAVLWKITLFEQLHVVAIWDDPTVKDCAWENTVIPTATPSPAPSA